MNSLSDNEEIPAFRAMDQQNPGVKDRKALIHINFATFTLIK